MIDCIASSKVELVFAEKNLWSDGWFVLTEDAGNVTVCVGCDSWTGRGAPQSWFWNCQDLWTDVTNKVERLTRLSTTVGYKINCKFPDKPGTYRKKR